MIVLRNPNSGRQTTFNSYGDLQAYLDSPGQQNLMDSQNAHNYVIVSATGSDATAGVQPGTPVSQYVQSMQQVGSSQGQIPPTQGVTPPATPPPPVPGGGPVAPGTQLSNPTSPVATATVPNTDISPYIPATSQQQSDIINQSIAQSQNVAGQDLQQLKGLINPYIQQQFSQYTDPNNPSNQWMMGQLNNMGMADSGAFPQALASRLAPLISQGALDLGQQALVPSFSTQQGLVQSGASDQSNLGLASLQRFIDQQNFQQQSTLANQLADKGVPSAGQTAVGMGSSILSGLGDFGKGIEGFSKVVPGTSYVCMELIKRDLLCESDMDYFHVHIMPAMFLKGRAFWKYAMDGWRLVQAANKVGIDWKEYKTMLFDRVMAEPDPCKAVDLYADACCKIALHSDASLWDPKVYRTSFWDSLPYFPKLLTYKPFVEALWKCVRIKTLFVYDKPRCERHCA